MCIRESVRVQKSEGRVKEDESEVTRDRLERRRDNLGTESEGGSCNSCI